MFMVNHGGVLAVQSEVANRNCTACPLISIVVKVRRRAVPANHGRHHKYGCMQTDSAASAVWIGVTARWLKSVIARRNISGKRSGMLINGTHSS